MKAVSMISMDLLCLITSHSYLENNMIIMLTNRHTVFLLKIRHENNNKNYCFSFAKFLEVNIQHSVCVRILFPFIA